MSWPSHMAGMDVWLHRWGGLLCGIAALLATGFLALLGYYIYNRHTARSARTRLDVEKALVQQVKPQATQPSCLLRSTSTPVRC